MATTISGFEGNGLSDVGNNSEYLNDFDITTYNLSFSANRSDSNSIYYPCEADDNFYYYFYNPSILDTVVVMTILSIVLLVGIVGNILVLVLIIAVKSMQTSFNRCLFSLAVADLLILAFLPVVSIAGDFYNNTVPIGQHLCNFLNMLDRGACRCSVLNFVYVTAERYIALCHPMKSRRVLTKTKTNVILCVIWLVSLASAWPYINDRSYQIVITDTSTYFYCYFLLHPDWIMWYDISFLVMTIYLSMPVLSVVYGKMIRQIRASVPKLGGDNTRDTVTGHRGRSRVVVMLLAMIIIFAACQIPITTIQLLDHFLPTAFSLFPYCKSVFQITWGFRVLVYVNSIVNPILYFSMSSKFRRAFAGLFGRCRRTNKNMYRR